MQTGLKHLYEAEYRPWIGVGMFWSILASTAKNVKPPYASSLARDLRQH